MALIIHHCIPFLCFTSSDEDECSQDLASAKDGIIESGSSTSTVSGATQPDIDVDVDSLINHINTLLKQAGEKKPPTGSKWTLPKEKEPPTGSKWTLPNGSDLEALEELLSSGLEFNSDLESVISGPLKEILDKLGHASVATAGLLVVSLTLERYNDMSTNTKDCLDLLHEMHYVAEKIVKKLKERAEEMRDVIEEATTCIVEGAMTCSIQNSSPCWKRFLFASTYKERLTEIKQKLSDMYKHIDTEINLRLLVDNKPVPLPRGYPEHAVGIEDSIERVSHRLHWGSKENARAVILHGFGGMGKTTLADAVVSRLPLSKSKYKYSKVKLFDDAGSLLNIEMLQTQILKELTESNQIPNIKEYQDGQRQLEEALKKVPALIYIDHVLDPDALQKLLPRDMDKAENVRLLLTARDINVRQKCPMRTIEEHPMEGILSEKAQRLFDGMPTRLNGDQINLILEKCAGIPLMLEKVANALRHATNKEEVSEVIEGLAEWNRGDFSLDKMESYFFPYDKLPKGCEDPFLDICSFFHEWDWDTVADIVGEPELNMLVSRAPVTRNKNGIAVVHDVILELGRKKSKEVRFRFTSESQVQEFLKQSKDTQPIKGVWLTEIESQVDIPAQQLDLMYGSLRVLALGKNTTVTDKCSKQFKELVFFQGGITDLPFEVSKSEKLKYLNYKPKDLNLSEMPSSLKHVEFDGSLHAPDIHISSSDLRQLKHLQILKLINFAQLTILPDDMGGVVNGLRELSLSGCTFIKQLPSSISKCRSLKLLDLSHCHSILNLPRDLGNLGGLVKLDLTDCNLQSIPESIGKLTLLQTLNMSFCFNLNKLPHGFCNLSAIKHLSLKSCITLEKLPDRFGKLTSLRVLNLSDCWTLEKLPEGFGQLEHLDELDLKKCVCLRELCKDFHSLSSLQHLDLRSCKMLEGKWMDQVVKLNKLRVVHMNGSKQLKNRWAEIQREGHQSSQAITIGTASSVTVGGIHAVGCQESSNPTACIPPA